MSGMVKSSLTLIDASKLTGEETSLMGKRIVSKTRLSASRTPPMAPDAFLTMLRSGVEAGRIKFTAKGDVEVVGRIYERAFTEEMAVVTKLYYNGLGWGDEQVESLAAALTYAHAKGGLRKVKQLWLQATRSATTACVLWRACFRGWALAVAQAAVAQRQPHRRHRRLCPRRRLRWWRAEGGGTDLPSDGR